MWKEPDEDWEIAVKRFQWSESAFSNGDPPVCTDSVVFPNSGLHDPDEFDDWSPDIAYDLETGDIHVVWTTWTKLAANKARLAYRMYWHDIDTWQGQCLVFQTGSQMNQWIPRIAIGSPGLPRHEYVVGVVYSQWAASAIHVGCAYWEPGSDPTDPDNGASFLSLPYNLALNAGLPRIAITPRCNSTHYGTIIFTQTLSTGQHQVVEVNNIRQVQNPQEPEEYFWPIVHITNPLGVLGSIACHIESGSGPMASFNYFEKNIPGVGWKVTNGRFNPIDPSDSVNVEWTVMPGLVSGELEASDYLGYTYAHPIQAGDIATVSVPDEWNNAYWAAWCNAIDQDAFQVYAAFGDTLRD